VICVKLMMMSKMNSMLISTAHTPIQYVFAGDKDAILSYS
jgi:hypothetical protein